MTEKADNPRDIRIEHYNYPLPDDRIARHPLARRDSCKLLVRNSDGTLADHTFTDIASLLPADAMLVYNNTRVINARLRFRKATAGSDTSGALIEIFCLEPVEPADYAVSFASTEQCTWLCFVGNSKRWKDHALHAEVTLADGQSLTLTATRDRRLDNASIVTFRWDKPGVTFATIIAAIGEIPIPPYLNRSTEQSDATDYQTVYAHIDGSVAAPTAGLHFTPEVLERIDSRDIPRRELTLHVGAGTFQPVKADRIDGHTMHSEFIAVERDLIAELASTTRRVIAVGTTSVRTLESLYHIGCLIRQGIWDGEVPQWYPYSEDHPRLTTEEALNEVLHWLDMKHLHALVASTRIIIAPGYRFAIVTGMVTNFHQPQSTLLLLVSAFAHGDWRRMYDHALANGYRFLSYGDASLLL